MRPDQLIDRLGGSAAVAEALKLEPNAVGNWRKRGFPAWALFDLRQLCQKSGIDPGDALKPRQPRRTKAAA